MTWSVLHAYFPGSIEMHCLVQDLLFGEDLMLSRHDYKIATGGVQITALAWREINERVHAFILSTRGYIEVYKIG